MTIIYRMHFSTDPWCHVFIYMPIISATFFFQRDYCATFVVWWQKDLPIDVFSSNLLPEKWLLVGGCLEFRLTNVNVWFWLIVKGVHLLDHFFKPCQAMKLRFKTQNACFFLHFHSARNCQMLATCFRLPGSWFTFTKNYPFVSNPHNCKTGVQSEPIAKRLARNI